MLLLDGLLGLAMLAFWIFCLVDVVTTPKSQVRRLPKLVWVLIVFVFFSLGAIAWLVAGRTWPGSSTELRYRGSGSGTPAFPDHELPGRFTATSAEHDEDFLRRCRERAEEQRRRYREQQGELEE